MQVSFISIQGIQLEHSLPVCTEPQSQVQGKQKCQWVKKLPLQAVQTNKEPFPGDMCHSNLIRIKQNRGMLSNFGQWSGLLILLKSNRAVLCGQNAEGSPFVNGSLSGLRRLGKEKDEAEFS